MISLFTDAGVRLGLTWNGIQFNAPVLTKGGETGYRLDTAAFSTPSNFHTEMVADIVKHGGGVEFYNPLVGTRILNLRGSIRATNESELVDQLVLFQRAFHPLLLQSEFGLNHAGTLTWPSPSGLPSWVRAKPLQFTRVMPTDTDPVDHSDGLFELQYHVAPLNLPDPVRSAVGMGIGVDYEAQFLVLDGGRAYDQTEKTLVGNGDVAWVWGKAPVWPEIEFAMDAAGSATLTITTTQGHMGTALVLKADTLSASDAVVIDCRERQIYVNDVATMSIYGSGDFPVLRGNGATTVAWTNTTNVTASSNLVRYRESDYI